MVGKRLFRRLTDSAIMFYAVQWLIVLLVIGTLAQKQIGLYVAQQTYFSSWFFDMGSVPVPGGRLTMMVIGVCLTLKLLGERNWGKRKIGVNIVHLGAVLLFVGGFLTAYFSTEGNLRIPEGQTSSVVRDYHLVELAVVDTTDSETDDVTAYGLGWLKEGQVLPQENRPFTIRVRAFAENARLEQRRKPATPDLKGVARRFELVAHPMDPEHERNRSGLLIEIAGHEDVDGTYIIAEGMIVDQTLAVEDKTYTIKLQKQQRLLPFAIELLDFEKTMHPNTEVAKSYRSIVHVVDKNGMKRRAIIQMNEPLRYMGYTLYQSSFFEGDVETTVLAVVKNFGRMFPYISSIVMCIGLLIHLLFHLPRLINRAVPTETSDDS